MKAKPESTAVTIDVRVAMLYAIFGGLWILLSDRLLEFLVTDHTLVSKLQTYKGWIFVASSALLIFSLLKRELALRRIAETGLRESEERYRLLFEHSVDAIIFSLLDDTAYAANPAACRMFGWNETEFLQMRRSNFLDPSDPRLQAALEERRRTGSFHGELTFVRQDGTKFPAEISSMIFKDREGNDRVSTILRDITERKEAEIELRESEQRFRTLIEQCSEGITLIGEEGNILEWNQAMEQITGISPDQAVGQPVWNIQFQMMPLEQQSSQTLESIKAVFIGILQTGTIPFGQHLDVNIRTSGGENKFVTQTIFTIKTARGYRVGSIVLDITDRKKAEEAILRNERQMRALVTSLDDIVFEFDANGTYLNIWAGDESLLARPNAQLLGQNIVDVLGQPSGVPFQNALIRVIQSGLPENIEYPLNVIGGQRWFLARISPILESDGARRTASVLVRDITDRKKAEDELRILNDRLEQRVAERTTELHQANVELEHASHAKDEFLATMSHELRTPLNSILGLSETLLEERRGPLNEYQQRSLHIIETSGQHLLELINDILDLSKIEAGKLDYIPQSVSVEDVCRSSLAFVGSQAARKGITITYENQSEVARISADARRLKQILVNLLANAVKFTPENGHVTLQVSTPAEQDLIQFSVTDNGIGIAPENLKRLFKPFVQLDSSLSRLHEGTGLGLALVQKLTDLHGGSVHVESEVGKGSRFTVNLSCKQAAILGPEKLRSPWGSEADSQAAIATNSSRGSAPRGVILLAEDNQPNILTIGEYLESHGYQVIIAHDGLEALTKADEFNPDLVLMDIQMPAMNGLEAITHLRAKPRFGSTPIIALTALAMPGDRERCLQAGANEYMSKPVSLRMLVTTIHAMLDSREDAPVNSRA